MAQEGQRRNGLGIGRLALLASGVFLGGLLAEDTGAEPSRTQPAPGRTATAHPTTPASTGVIVEGGKLSVLLRGAKFQDVMDAISLQGGIEISVVGEAGQTTLTESFTGLPLEEGLVSLLRDKNFAFVYSVVEGERRVTNVIVTPRRSSQPAEARPPTTVFLPEDTGAAIDIQRETPVAPPIPPASGVFVPPSAPPRAPEPGPPAGNPGLFPNPSGMSR
ncbi:MAG: hypothetical protein ACREIH_04660 [Nitrospiraceae bacterium]